MKKSALAITLLQISFIPLFLYWCTSANLTEVMIAIFVCFLFGGIGVSGTYHRLLAHRSYTVSKLARFFGSLCGSLSLSGSPIAWAAVHRDHHRFNDTDKDPHSPYHKGLIYVLFLSAYSQSNIARVPDLLRCQFQVRLHNYYWYLILLYVAILAFIDIRAILYAWAVPAMITWYGSALVNSWGHNWGRNTESKNSLLLALLTWGEGWHANHHARASSAIFYPNLLLDLGSLPARLYGKLKN